MSNDVVIQMRGLGKRYRLAHTAQRTGGYRTLREELGALPGRWLRRWRENRAARDEFWALRDLSFEVRSGEVLGVIGRNGAGKSTLLKILSRIVEPTAGEAEICGRIGSLLEVGTGFHPELTGRENIFLSGALLGMRRHEVRARFDEIVAFAEVERFLDTPCKHYSSGMYTRLGFAVAAHLDAAILLVDEVLAVGDAEFQRKCLGKMTEIASGGRTVLFVSHNMAAVAQLCDRGLVLERGQAVFCGKIDAAIAAYRAQFAQAGIGSYHRTGPDAESAWITNAKIGDTGRHPAGCVAMSEPIDLEVTVRSRTARRLALSVQVREFGQAPLIHCPSADVGQVIPVEAGDHRVRIALPALFLYPGNYGLRLVLTAAGGGAYEVLDVVEQLTLTVEQDATVCTRPLSRAAGVVYVRPRWEYLGRP